jgi:hypothetical protein
MAGIAIALLVELTLCCQKYCERLFYSEAAMTFNEGTWDRVIRILAGVALWYVAWVTWPGTASLMSPTGAVSLVSCAIGAIALLTGLVGWCPAYALFDVSTKKRVGA